MQVGVAHDNTIRLVTTYNQMVYASLQTATVIQKWVGQVSMSHARCSRTSSAINSFNIHFSRDQINISTKCTNFYSPPKI